MLKFFNASQNEVETMTSCWSVKYDFNLGAEWLHWMKNQETVLSVFIQLSGLFTTCIYFLIYVSASQLLYTIVVALPLVRLECRMYSESSMYELINS